MTYEIWRQQLLETVLHIEWRTLKEGRGLINHFLNLAPIKIYGEGHYAIGVAKALTATQSFLR